MTSVSEFMSAAQARLEGNTPWASLTLPSGHVVLVDEADLPAIEQFKWHASRRPNRRTLYVQTHGSVSSGQGRAYLHRFLLEAPAGLQVDHRNGNGLDNQRSNLRLSTRGQNNANRPADVDGSSGYRGVSLHQNDTNPWRARIRVDGRDLHLGYFSDPWAAAQTYNDAARDLWGEFALLNVRLP